MPAQLIPVARDAAKQLFAHREPAPLVQFVHDLAAAEDVETLSLPDDWGELDRVFHAADGEQATLQWAITGGRPLAGLDLTVAGPTVQLKRPDVVAQLADATRQYAAKAAQQVPHIDANVVTQLVRFYETAAADQAAVLFVADLNPNGET